MRKKEKKEKGLKEAVFQPQARLIITVFSLVMAGMVWLCLLNNYADGNRMPEFSPTGVFIVTAPVAVLLVYRTVIRPEAKTVAYLALALLYAVCMVHCAEVAYRWISETYTSVEESWRCALLYPGMFFLLILLVTAEELLKMRKRRKA